MFFGRDTPPSLSRVEIMNDKYKQVLTGVAYGEHILIGLNFRPLASTSVGSLLLESCNASRPDDVMALAKTEAEHYICQIATVLRLLCEQNTHLDYRCRLVDIGMLFPVVRGTTGFALHMSSFRFDVVHS